MKVEDIIPDRECICDYVEEGVPRCAYCQDAERIQKLIDENARLEAVYQAALYLEWENDWLSSDALIDRKKYLRLKERVDAVRKAREGGTDGDAE